MHDIHLVLHKLNEYFDRSEDVDKLQERYSNIQNIEYEILINNLTEICTECRQTRESKVFDNTHDSWEYLSKVVPIKHMNAFFTGLLNLGQKDPTNFLYQKLSITACQTYIMLLTSPGAKIFNVFEPPLMQRIFKIFNILKHLAPFKEHLRVQLQMAIFIFMGDLILYLKHVSFEGYEELQLELIHTISSIMEYHHENGLANKCKFNCFIVICIDRVIDEGSVTRS